MMQLILENISKHVSLTTQEELLFLSRTETKKCKAKTIVLNAGEISKSTYFVNSGILRSFTINDNINEHILHFACQGWWISDVYSYIYVQLYFRKTWKFVYRSVRRCRNY